MGHTATGDQNGSGSRLEQGYIFVPGRTFAGWAGLGAEVDRFAREWDALPADPYTDAAPYRYRRHGVLVYQPGTGRPRLLPQRDYLQSVANNPLYGGVRRRFAQVRWTAVTEHVLSRLIAVGVDRVLRLASPTLVNVHMVRIVGDAVRAGTPAPEGPHRDGFDHISVHLIARDVDRGGETTISTEDGQPLSTVTLAEPMDVVYVDDRQLRHYTAPIAADGRPALRDVVLLSYEPYDPATRDEPGPPDRLR
jgi:hypothetical protein